MFDVSDDAKGGFRRVEVLTGPGRRRRWSADEKIVITKTGDRDHAAHLVEEVSGVQHAPRERPRPSASIG